MKQKPRLIKHTHVYGRKYIYRKQNVQNKVKFHVGKYLQPKWEHYYLTPKRKSGSFTVCKLEYVDDPYGHCIGCHLHYKYVMAYAVLLRLIAHN